MRFWDLHCDTITECRKNGYSLRENTLHLDLRRGKAFDAWVQTYAIWIPDTLRGDAAWRYYLDHYAFFCRETDGNGVAFCRNAAEIGDALQKNVPAALLAVEGGAVLGGDLEKLRRLSADGVRILTLTWNAENELGFGCQSCGGRLKPFGRDVLRAMQTLPMLPDVSHLDRTGFYDVLEHTVRPVLASHSTSASVLAQTRLDGEDKRFSLRRVLDDDQIRALSAHGGLIGLNFCGSFLGDPGDDGMEAALRHANRILEIGGADVLAIGSDFDGCTMHPAMSGVQYIPSLYAYFRQNGLDDTVCQKIFFGNAWQFFKNVL